VFIPLLAVAAIVYALVPGLRRRIWWAVALLAVAGAGAAFVARQSGHAFKARLISKNLSSPEILDKVTQHSKYGDLLLWWTLGLAAAALLLVAVSRGRRRVAAATGGADAPKAKRSAGATVVTLILAVAVLGLSAASLYYVFKTGDSGAKIVWTGF
jgi:hypothetical protein